MFRIGIIGAGHIAEKMAATINGMPEAEAYAVASRQYGKAAAFAGRFGFAKAFGSYEALVEDPAVDLVYVATPHSLHYDHVRLCLGHGKAVLCEKSFMANAREAEEVTRISEENNVFLAEAIWTRYMPFRKTLRDIVDSGAIGRPMMLSAHLGYPVADKERLVRPELGGGALLDLGVYAINFALMAVKDRKITEQSGLCVKNEYGADIRETMDMITEDGVAISLFADTETLSDRRGIIYGTKGRIEVDNVNNPGLVEVLLIDNRTFIKTEEHVLNHHSTGFEYELLEAVKAIGNGKTESESMPWKATLDVLSIMDSYRKAWGVRIGSECR